MSCFDLRMPVRALHVLVIGAGSGFVCACIWPLKSARARAGGTILMHSTIGTVGLTREGVHSRVYGLPVPWTPPCLAAGLG